jgi:cytochrome c553
LRELKDMAFCGAFLPARRACLLFTSRGSRDRCGAEILPQGPGVNRSRNRGNYIADVAVHVTGLGRLGKRGIGSGEFAEQGSRIYRAKCHSCHGEDAEGDSVRGVPRLAGQHYGYLLRQMYDAVDGRRPALPRLHSERIAPLDFEQVRAVSDGAKYGGAPWPPEYAIPRTS